MTTTLSPGLVDATPTGGGRVRAPALLRIQRLVDLPTRWTLLALGGWVVWRTRTLDQAGPWAWIMAGYLLVALITSSYWLSHRSAASRPPGRRDVAVTYAGYAADALFAGALIWRDGGLSSPLYILLVVLALKGVGLAAILPEMIWAPFAFGPLYAAALRLAAGNFAFLADDTFVSRYILLWVWLIGLTGLAWELTRRTAQALALDQALGQQQAALAQKTEVLQRTATDLGDRVLELRALQEVARALATTLRTEETLQMVAETLRRITGRRACAVGLFDASAASNGDEHLIDGMVVSEQWKAPLSFSLPLTVEPGTRAAAQQGRSVRVDQDRHETPLQQLLDGAAYTCTPLVSRGQSIGALYVTEPDSAAAPVDSNAGEGPRPATEQLLTSFAYFAATAVENARLYQDAWEKRRELEAVLAGIGDAVVVADPDLALILMNPVACDILGFDREPPTGVPLRAYLNTTRHHDAAAGDSEQAFIDLLSDTLTRGQEQRGELELRADAPGSEPTRVYGALASPVLDAEGDVRGVVAVLRDITAQKELERMKSNFLSVVSHELRTPLHSIKGFVEIILMGKTGPVTELQEDFLKTVRTQTTALQRMIDDLLEFSRMEAGRIKLHLSEVSLTALARSVAAKLVPLAEEAALRLVVDFPAHLPQIDGDRVRLEQVLTNLVENAIKFTPAGGEVRMAAARLGDRVRLTVADTGIGVPLDEQDKVFNRFYQVDGSERRAYRGAGLGLSISKHIVERHLGRIWVESDGVAGHGSRFHVDLPIELRLGEAPTIDFITPAPPR